MPPEKLHVNTGTIGHVDHGKTTLSSALTRLSHLRCGTSYSTYGDIAGPRGNSRSDGKKIVTVTADHVEHETENRHYAHVDCPGHADYVKNMISGAAQMDAAIITVDATQGRQPQTAEHILLASQTGVKHIVIAINKCDHPDCDPDLLELVEMEIRELLTKYGYDGDNSQIVRISALQAIAEMSDGSLTGTWTQALIKLTEALDALPDPVRDYTSPFMMAVEGVSSIEGRGTVLTGVVLKGTAKIGTAVSIIGYEAEPLKTTITGTQAFHKDVQEIRAGDNVGILVRGIKTDQVRKGMVVCIPGTVKLATEIVVNMQTLTKEEGGRPKPFFPGYQPTIFVNGAGVTGKIEEIQDGATSVEGREGVQPGTTAKIKFSLNKNVGVVVGQRVAIREGGKTIGGGEVLEATWA